MEKEPTLKHVSVWEPLRGWVPITPEGAAERFHRTVSANENRLLCECCNQYVTFSYSELQRPHFRHFKGSNDCEEKLNREPFYQKNRLGFSLPLKITKAVQLFNKSVRTHELGLEIGFLPVPEEKLLLSDKHQAKLRITANDTEQLTIFRINEKRFSSDYLTYCPIGNHVAENYILHFENISPDMFRSIWPPIVRGISPQGTLFDYDTGKRLPERPFVTIKRPYILVTRNYYHKKWIKDKCNLLDSKGNEWHIYKIQTEVFDKEADSFFRLFGAQLTDEISELVPLWPIATYSSHVMNYRAPQYGDQILLFYMSGNNKLETTGAPPPTLSHDGKLQRVLLQSMSSAAYLDQEAQQILTMSRFQNHKRVLRYIVVQKRDNPTVAPQAPSVTVTDINGHTIDGECFDILPAEKKLLLISPADGFVEIYNGDLLRNRLLLPADKSTEISVTWHNEIKIYIGLDLIRRLSFKKKKKSTPHTEDKILVQQLIIAAGNKEMTITPRVGGLALNLKQYPLTRLWLLQQVRSGKISKRSYQILKKIIRR